MATFNKFNCFVEDIVHQAHWLGVDTLKVMLVDSPAPIATNSIKADLTEIAAGFGYTAGGEILSVTTDFQVGGVYTMGASDLIFTAVGGSIGPFRYAVLYNDVPTAPLPVKPLICWFDYGSSTSLNAGDTLTISFPSDVLTIT